MSVPPNPELAKAVGDILINLGIQLAKQVVPPLVKIVTDAGIEALKGYFKQPEGCPSNAKIQELINIRNNILKTLNPTSKTLESLIKTLDTANKVLNVTNTSITIAEGIVAAYVKIAPTIQPPLPVPPQIFATYATLDEIRPLLYSAQNYVNITNIAANIVYNIIVKIIEILNAIDLHLNECSGLNNLSQSTNPPDLNNLFQLTKIDSFAQSIFDQYQALQTSKVDIYTAFNTIYNGFTLEIVTGSYAPTSSSPKLVTSKAVGKNAGGIILIETEYSFTTTPKVLIDELKIRIDNENLIAY